MTGKKSSREKRRKRSGQEAAAALATPDLVATLAGSGSDGAGGGGNAGFPGSVAGAGGGLERGERRKRRSTDSSSGVSGSVPQVRARLSRRCVFGRMRVTVGERAGLLGALATKIPPVRRGVSLSAGAPALPCFKLQVPEFAGNELGLLLAPFTPVVSCLPKKYE